MTEPQSVLFWGGPKHLQRIACRGSTVIFKNPDGSESRYNRCWFARRKKISGEEFIRLEKAYAMILDESRSIAEYDEIAKQLDIHFTDGDWNLIGFAEKEETA